MLIKAADRFISFLHGIEVDSMPLTMYSNQPTDLLSHNEKLHSLRHKLFDW